MGSAQSKSKDAAYILRIADVERPAAVNSIKPSPELHAQRGRRGSLTLNTASPVAAQGADPEGTPASPGAKCRAELSAEPPGRLVRRHSVSGISLSSPHNRYETSTHPI